MTPAWSSEKWDVGFELGINHPYDRDASQGQIFDEFLTSTTSYDYGEVFGFNIGYWPLRRLRLGLAVEESKLHLEERTNFTFIPQLNEVFVEPFKVSGTENMTNVMLTADYVARAGKKLRPFIGAGVGYSIDYFDNFGIATDRKNQSQFADTVGPIVFDEDEYLAIYEARAGVSWQLSPKVSVGVLAKHVGINETYRSTSLGRFGGEDEEVNGHNTFNFFIRIRPFQGK
ncbi:MAG: hypothetical protein MRY72_06670 [Aquisalinus sp.]|nr:hypothetical protein [Aquisalinus sp.]